MENIQDIKIVKSSLDTSFSLFNFVKTYISSFLFNSSSTDIPKCTFQFTNKNSILLYICINNDLFVCNSETQEISMNK